MGALDWIQDYPALSLLLVFLVAFGESLALVGMIVPGAILMVSFGALIAASILPFWPTVLAAFLGAIAGDGLSYYLGARYQQHLARIWPLTRYPDLIPSGEAFFKRHGAKSVLLGRFFGPLRAIIPAIAGMLGMPRSRFFIVNIISAALWAPIYLLPGIIFAASLELASEMTARIALFLLVFIISFMLLAWLVKHLYLFTTPRLEQGILGLMHWIEQHPRIGKVPGSIINPQQSELLGLSVIGITLLLLIVFMSLVLQWTAHWPLVNNLDRVLADVLQQLHHPFLDQIMLLVSTLGNPDFLAVIFVGFVLWKLSSPGRKETFLLIMHWLAAALLPVLVMIIIPLLSPLAVSTDLVMPSLLPNGELMLATSLYGFLSVYLVQFISIKRKWLVYFSASISTLFIGFSLLYFSWGSVISILGGYVFGLIWVGLLGLALRRHELSITPVRRSQWFVLALVFLAFIFTYPVFYNQQLAKLPTPLKTIYTLQQDNWMDTGWTVLPLLRQDLRGYNQHPFNLQWGDPQQRIALVMKKAGWRKTDNNKLQFLQWLNPTARTEDLYVMPHVHNGKYETLLWIRTLDKNRLAVLRLWQSNFMLNHSGKRTPLWYGSVSVVEKTQHWGLTYLRTREEFEEPLQHFKRSLGQCVVVQKKRNSDKPAIADNTVLLVSRCHQD